MNQLPLQRRIVRQTLPNLKWSGVWNGPCSFTCYSGKCFTQIYRALYGDAMLVPFGGTSVITFCHKSEKLLF